MNHYLLLALALLLYMMLWFLIAIVKKRNDVADVAWGLGFVFLAWISFYLADQHLLGLLVNTLVTIWGVRLTWHIYSRNHGQPEDFRYQQWRQEWKHFYVTSFFRVFMLQGIFLYITMLPVLFINLSNFHDFKLLDLIGLMTWVVGFYFESLGDYQLKQFKALPGNKGKIMTTGLWRFTRHPNYFGEAVQWWGIFMVAVSLPDGWTTVIGPITITFLVRYISGVPMLEKKYKGNEEFEAYKKRTSAFWPRPPKTDLEKNMSVE
jgi:steroid 5-alpha reductase family enzyme